MSQKDLAGKLLKREGTEGSFEIKSGFVIDYPDRGMQPMPGLVPRVELWLDKKIDPRGNFSIPGLSIIFSLEKVNDEDGNGFRYRSL